MPAAHKDFPVAAVASLRTGTLLCDFSKAQEFAAWLMGHPIYTHHFVALRDDIEKAIAAQFPELPTEIEGVTRENYQDHVAALEARFGKMLSVERGSGLTELLPTDGLPEGVKTIVIEC